MTKTAAVAIAGAFALAQIDSAEAKFTKWNNLIGKIDKVSFDISAKLKENTNPFLSWLNPDIDIYSAKQPRGRLQDKLVEFESELTDEKSEFTGECKNPQRFKEFVDKAARYGFWDDRLFRENNDRDIYENEIMAYNRRWLADDATGLGMYETSYHLVSKMEKSDTHLDLVFHTSHHSMTDGFSQWTLTCENGALDVSHRIVARVNPNMNELIQKLAIRGDANAGNIQEYLANINKEETEYAVERLVAIINDGESPCEDGFEFNCYWWKFTLKQ